MAPPTFQAWKLYLIGRFWISLSRKLYDVIIQQLTSSEWAKWLYQKLCMRQRDISPLYLHSTVPPLTHLSIINRVRIRRNFFEFWCRERKRVKKCPVPRRALLYLAVLFSCWQTSHPLRGLRKKVSTEKGLPPVNTSIKDTQQKRVDLRQNNRQGL